MLLAPPGPWVRDGPFGLQVRGWRVEGGWLWVVGMAEEEGKDCACWLLPATLGWTSP